MSSRAVAGWIATAVVAIAVLAGLVLIGSPGASRAGRMDAQRVRDLQQIAGAVDLFWTRHARLPASFSELEGEPGVSLPPGDPQTGEPYDYRVLTAATYELCASFNGRSAGSRRVGWQAFWEHGPGRQCFQVEATRIRR